MLFEDNGFDITLVCRMAARQSGGTRSTILPQEQQMLLLRLPAAVRMWYANIKIQEDPMSQWEKFLRSI
jgi:hypothetical protein